MAENAGGDRRAGQRGARLHGVRVLSAPAARHRPQEAPRVSRWLYEVVSGHDQRFAGEFPVPDGVHAGGRWGQGDRKSTRLNSSHLVISYAVFCLKKKKK